MRRKNRVDRNCIVVAAGTAKGVFLGNIGVMVVLERMGLQSGFDQLRAVAYSSEQSSERLLDAADSTRPMQPFDF